MSVLCGCSHVERDSLFVRKTWKPRRSRYEASHSGVVDSSILPCAADGRSRRSRWLGSWGASTVRTATRRASARTSAPLTAKNSADGSRHCYGIITVRREKMLVRGRDQLATRERQARPCGVAERSVLLKKPGHAGGGKGPQLKGNARSDEDGGIDVEPNNPSQRLEVADGVTR